MRDVVSVAAKERSNARSWRMFDTTFRNIADLVREHARARPPHPALVQGDRRSTCGALDALMDRIAAALQRDGVSRARRSRSARRRRRCSGAVPRRAARRRAVAPLAPSVTPAELRVDARDAHARLLFIDAARAALVPAGADAPLHRARRQRAGQRRSTTWLAAAGREAAAGRRQRPTRRSTSSTRRARPARRKASCSRTACAGCTRCAARPTATGPTA